mmetsp:Transcript_61003/g.196518  ORF Transcript_61003/g.196518 Transcript_61003/m.196518 type:complete len:495 (+) Transcript_61003:905-2389(+)
MAWLPATCELLAIAAYGHIALNYTPAESMVLATVLVAIGDGLVIPKMKEFGMRFKGHPMPRLVFTWAPLEASFVLTLFGILVGLSAPAHMPSVNMGLLVFANVLRIAATLLAGAILGGASGWLIPRRTKVTLSGQQVFTGASVEAFLMVLAVALCAFGLGAGDVGKELVPMRFSPGSLFQPELLVIVTGTSFAAVADHNVLHDVEGIMGGVWVFGQLVLFSMLGSRTTPSIFPELINVLPVMAVGITFRFIGVFLGIGLILWTDASGHPFKRGMIIQDALFCFLSTLPRATIQGALGAVPVSEHFFQHCPYRHNAQAFIFMAARLYIVCMSVCGMILLNFAAPCLLDATNSRLLAVQSHATEEEETDAVLMEQFDAGRLPDSPGCQGRDVASALEILGAEYSMSAEAVLGAIQRASCLDSLSEGEELGFPVRTASEPPTSAKLLSPATDWPGNPGRRRGERLLGIHARPCRSRPRNLALAQFDLMGPVTSEVVR